MRGIDNIDRTLLQMLRLYGVVHCSQLAIFMQRSRDFMKERLYKLEDMGYVRTVSDPGRRNIKLLVLTQEGNRIAVQGYAPLRQSGMKDL